MAVSACRVPARAPKRTLPRAVRSGNSPASWGTYPTRRRSGASRRWRALSRNTTSWQRSEEHTSELQSPYELVCRLLLEKKKRTLTRRRRWQGEPSDHQTYSATDEGSARAPIGRRHGQELLAATHGPAEAAVRPAAPRGD